MGPLVLKAAAAVSNHASDQGQSQRFRRWFGRGYNNQSEHYLSDASITLRIQQAYSKMTSAAEWTPGCCTSTSQDWLCARACTPSTLAFVQIGLANIYFCSGMIETSTPIQLGSVVFHETLHLIGHNAVADGNGLYSLDDLESLAATDPQISRMTAQAYVFFVLEEGLADNLRFLNETLLWGTPESHLALEIGKLKENWLRNLNVDTWDGNLNVDTWVTAQHKTESVVDLASVDLTENLEYALLTRSLEQNVSRSNAQT